MLSWALCFICVQWCRNRGAKGATGASPPIFGSSVNPILTEGGQIIPTYCYCPTPLPLACSTYVRKMYVNRERSFLVGILIWYIWPFFLLFRPPDGCLQYQEGLTGRIETFNFPDQTSSHLADQSYAVCVSKCFSQDFTILGKGNFVFLIFRFVVKPGTVASNTR